MARLYEEYKTNFAPELLKTLGMTNIFSVPRLEKVVLNMGVGEATQDSKHIAKAAEELAVIAGQKPIITRAKVSISTFKVREGMNLGVKVTLRRERMYEFIDRLVHIALPRIRDFRGLSSRSFDGRGNYSLGIKEQIVFPEINYDKVDKIRGLDITIVTTANTDEHAKELLKAFEFPFVN